MTAVKFPCVTCNKEVQIRDQAIQCELCKSWEHTNCMREVDRISEGLYAMLCEVQCNALWAVCSNCRGKGSLIHKLQELETRVVIMEHQQQMNKLLLDEKERLVEHLQKELSEVKAEKDKLQQLLEKQRVEQLQWSESKVVSMGASMPTVPVQKPESALPQQPLLESHPQPTQFENLHEDDSHSSESDSGGTVSFKYPPAFRELQKRIDKFAGKSDENDFEVWLVDFIEATNDCMWTDVERARWFSWFLASSAKVSWQRTIKPEDKASWQKIVEIFRGQYGVHMDPRTAYQHCHDLQYDSFGSVQGLLESMRDYQRMAPQKLSDANLESILWNKVPIKLQKEVGPMTEGSLQELFQKLLKAEEVVKERERRSSHRGSTTREFRSRYNQRTPAQGNTYTLGQQNIQREEKRAQMQQDSLKNIKCFRCGRKGHVAKSCYAVVNQVGVENTNKGQHLTLTQQVTADSKQVAANSNSQQVAANSKQLQVAADSKQAWIRVLSVSDCTNKSADLCQTDVIGSMYKVDITIHGVPARALMDSGSQVCIVRKQLLPIVKDKCNWSLSDCLVHNLPLNNQPVGAEGSVLGATALVNLEVVVESTGKSLKVPCYVIDSTKPVWRGDANNCGMIMGSNAFVAFQFHILHANGIEILPVNSVRSLVVDPTTQLEPTDSLEQAPEEMSPHIKSTELFECYKPTQLSQQLAELVILPMPKVPKKLIISKNLNVPSNKLLVVLKSTTQVMPGITKWIDVQVQRQSSVTDFGNDDAVCSNMLSVSNDFITPEQCTEQSVPQLPCTSSDQATLQHNDDPHCLSMIVPNENMIIDEQCDLADGICNCEELSKVSIMNWGTQPQVFKKGTIVGYIEQASLVGHSDPIWKDHWEELPEYSDESMVRMCQTENRMDQLRQQIKISDHCSDKERDLLLNRLLEKNEVFALCDEELGETDTVKHFIDTSGAKPVKEAARRLPYALRQQLEVELDKLLKIKCIEPANSPYASPLVLVRKPDGNLRVCVDYRSVNKDTIPDRYPLPRVDELIDAIGACKAVYFTSLDLMRGYHQVKMAEESKNCFHMSSWLVPIL